MASGGGACSKGGSSKSGGGKEYTETITRSKKMQTSALDANVLVLRAALFEESGADKDVLKPLLPIFKMFKKNGLNVDLEFSVKLGKRDFNWAFDLTKKHMEQTYEDSEYGWDDEDKSKELKEDGARFILARDKDTGKLVGFAHFRFTVQGEVMQQMTGTTCLYVWDLQVEEAYQRKGLGAHMLKVMELIALQQRMKFVSVPVQNACDTGIAFITNTASGYVPDVYLKELLMFSAEEEGFQVYSKELGASRKVATPAAPAAAAVTENKEPTPAECDKNIFGFGSPAPAPASTNNVFGFGEPAVTTPVSKGKAAAGVVETSPTSIALQDPAPELDEAIDRLTIQ